MTDRTTLPIYTTFADDVFHYTCAGCGLCCHGNGIVIDMEREGSQLLARHPALRYFAVRAGRLLSLENSRDRCWFLAEDARCRIEVELGKEHKPFLCNLFPYKPLGVHRGRLVVTLNTLCPFHLASSPGSIALNDGALRRELQRVGFDTMSPLLRDLRRPDLDLEHELEIKRWCADPASAPAYAELLRGQLELTDPHPGVARDLLARAQDRWRELFGFQSDEPLTLGDSASSPGPYAGLSLSSEDSEVAVARDVDRVMAALTPLLRLELRMSAGKKVLTLMAIDALARQVRRLSGRIRPTQVVSLSTRVPLVRFLTSLDEVPLLAPAPRSHKLPASLPNEQRRLLRKLLSALRGNGSYRLTTYELLRSLALPPAELIEFCVTRWPATRAAVKPA